MAIAELYTNTATVSTSEYSLPNNSTTPAAITTDGVYQVFIDTANMAAGDQFSISIKEKATAGGTQRLIEQWILDGAQSKPLFVSPTFIFLHGWDVTMRRLAGADREFSWSIRQVA